LSFESPNEGICSEEVGVPDCLRIGNAQGFWGDSVAAPAALVAQQPDLDYLTLDYLAEVSLSIMAIQRDRDPSVGYARDFVEVVRSLIPAWKAGSKVKIVTNAGGLNPKGCADAVAKVLRENGLAGKKIGVVGGDDCLAIVRGAAQTPDDYKNIDTGEPIEPVRDRLTTANAYIGAAPVAEVLAQGAEIVVTGRVADPSLTVAPCIHRFGWKADDWDRLAGATIAGHLIECGTQVCGGISTDWMTLEDPTNIGFPVVEIDAKGDVVVTKPKGTGGKVSIETVKEQLLYEIGDPGNYLSPDVTVSFLKLAVEQVGVDRVKVSGAVGRPATAQFKVSATYREGYKASGTLTVYGPQAVAKARKCGRIVLERVRQAGFELDRSLVECLGTGACAGGLGAKIPEADLIETVLRISVADRRKEAIERFSKELAPLVTSGPQGTTGYAAGRPSVQPVFGYWPCLIDKSKVKTTTSIVEA
jgi:hypothetical protein